MYRQCFSTLIVSTCRFQTELSFRCLKHQKICGASSEQKTMNTLNLLFYLCKAFLISRVPALLPQFYIVWEAAGHDVITKSLVNHAKNRAEKLRDRGDRGERSFLSTRLRNRNIGTFIQSRACYRRSSFMNLSGPIWRRRTLKYHENTIIPAEAVRPDQWLTPSMILAVISQIDVQAFTSQHVQK